MIALTHRQQVKTANIALFISLALFAGGFWAAGFAALSLFFGLVGFWDTIENQNKRHLTVDQETFLHYATASFSFALSLFSFAGFLFHSGLF